MLAVPGLPRTVQGRWPSVGDGDRPGAQSWWRGPAPSSHRSPHSPGLDWPGGDSAPAPWSSAPPSPSSSQLTGRWPKRAPAPGKLRDPSQYWSHPGQPGEPGAWPGHGWPVPAGGFTAGHQHGQYHPPAWYGGPGGGATTSPTARTNNTNSSRTGTPTTTTTTTTSGGEWPPAGACAWEWWPPDPPEEWALSNTPWEPPGTALAQQVSHLNGYHHQHQPANGHDERTVATSGVWWAPGLPTRHTSSHTSTWK